MDVQQGCEENIVKHGCKSMRANYRQVLRDLPSQYDTIQSMNAIAWPTPPNNEVIEVTIW